MRRLTRLAMFAVLSLGLGGPSLGADMLIEDFQRLPETRWRFFSDTVMGGVSSGRVQFLTEEGRTHARLTGRVSIENNGGFLQMRLDLSAPAPDGATGVRLIVRGNDERYFVFLRSTGTLLPWHYYRAGFAVTRDWREVRLPFSAFEPSAALLRATPRPSGLTSLGVVAYGRAYDAEIDVREVGFY